MRAMITATCSSKLHLSKAEAKKKSKVKKEGATTKKVEFEERRQDGRGC